MQKKIVINIDSELLNYTAQYFGIANTETNYSELVEKVLLYFLKPQFEINQNILDKKNNIEKEHYLSQHIGIIDNESAKEMTNCINSEFNKIEGEWL